MYRTENALRRERGAVRLGRKRGNGIEGAGNDKGVLARPS